MMTIGRSGEVACARQGQGAPLPPAARAMETLQKYSTSVVGRHVSAFVNRFGDG
jgi:hypothetical protein